MGPTFAKHPELEQYWREKYGQELDGWPRSKFILKPEVLEFWKNKFGRLPEMDDFVALYEEEGRRWKESDVRRELYQKIDAQMPAGGWKFEMAFCIGAGDLDILALHGRGLGQIAVFLDLVAHLQSFQDAKIDILLADHSWKALDHQILSALSIASIHKEDFNVVNLVTPRDFTFCPGTPLDFTVLACQGTRLYFGNPPRSLSIQQVEWMYGMEQGAVQADGSKQIQFRGMTSGRCDKSYTGFDARTSGWRCLKELWIYVKEEGAALG